MTEFIDRAGLPEATEFIRRKLTAFDLSKLDKLTLKASLRSNPLSWRVKKPIRAAKGSRQFESQFEVTGLVIGSKYHSASSEERIEIPVIGPREFGAPPELTVALSTRADLLVYAAAAGLYHFLRRTKQIPGVAANWMARRYACGWVKEFYPRIEFGTSGSVHAVHPYFNCFGVEVPTALVERTENAARFFEYPVARYDKALGVEEIVASMRQAVGIAIDETLGDCDASIRNEIKTAEDPSSSWLILADWLEERGDPRAVWIRAHNLHRVWQFRQDVRPFTPRRFNKVPNSDSSRLT